MKIAIVTGAAQGIGRRTADVLAAAGYGLLLMDLHACAATVAAVKGLGVEVEEVLGDISDEAVVERAVEVVRSRWGRADVLVNNAGISFIAPAETVEGRAFRRVLEVNLLAPFLLAKGFGAMMLEQRSGSIVNVASIAGLVGIGDRSAYNASSMG
jgi:NAD(P)-dependent dehydrogenase (short-subunit alcohol dehydrogenase family)